MNTKSLCLFILATILVSIDAHGYMIEPAARGSIFRLNNPASFPVSVFPRISHENEWCDDAKNPNFRKVTCGVCGPIYYNDPGYYGRFELGNPVKFNTTVTSYERNSFLYKNVPSMSEYIVKAYKKGELIFTKMKVKSNLFKFRSVLFSLI